MDENVARLERKPDPEKKLPVKEVPALGISIVSNFPGERGITVQCHIGSDESLDKQNELVDRMFAVVDRQKAKYELPEVETELELHKKTLARLEEDLKEVEHNFNRAQAVRRAEKKALERELEDAERECGAKHDAKLKAMIATLAEYQGKRDVMFNEGYNEFVASGRAGEYRPDGHRKANLERFDSEIEKFKASIEHYKGERDQVIAVETASIQKLITEKQEEIDRATAERGQHITQTDISKKRYREEIASREAKIKRLKARLGEPARG